MEVQDLDILDNLAAADPALPVEEQQQLDNPMQHVSEDELRNLDSVMIQMPQAQEQAEKAGLIATEAIALRKRGRMHALEAEALATLVPAIQGTAEEPISYTTVPTAVGVSQAVEIMETEAQNVMEIAARKTTDCIERVVHQAPELITKFENEFAAASGSYLQAREACKEATGGMPESNYTMALGDEAAPHALGRVAGTLNNSETAGALGTYAKALEPLVGTAFDGYYLFVRPVVVRLGDNLFRCADIIAGEVEPLVRDTNANGTNVTFAATLSAPMLVYPETAKSLQEAIAAAVKQLQAIQVSLDGHEANHDGQQVVERTALVSKAAVLIGLVRAMQESLEKIVKLTQVATDFYNDCAKGAVVVSTERRESFLVAKAGRLFS